MRATEFLVESITFTPAMSETKSYQPPKLEVGDTILKGRFKNSPAEIKGFKKDKHNHPVLKTNKGEVQLFKPRISKLMDKEKTPLDESKIEDKIRAHPAVSYYGGANDDYFVELKPGWEIDGQRSFGNESASEAAKMLKYAKKIEGVEETKGLPFPSTYEQESEPFMRKTGQRIVAMTNEELNEIDYTPGMEPLQISVEQLVASAKRIGDLDNHDVWKYDDGKSQVYFTMSDSIDALIIMQGNKLRGIKNYSGTKGLITMLVGFVVHRLGMKVVIEKNEQFTDSGIDWLCSLIRAGGRGLTLTDNKGKYPDADSLYSEWTTAMKGTTSGSTRITIESNLQRKLNTKQQNLNEGRLMPATWFVGSDTP